MNTLEIIFTILTAITGGLFILAFVESLANLTTKILSKLTDKDYPTIIHPSTWIVPAVWFMIFVASFLFTINF